jgi:hypothetical protein
MNVEKDILMIERDALLQEKTEAQETHRSLSTDLEASKAEVASSRALLRTLTSALELPDSDVETIGRSVIDLKEKLRAAEQAIEARSADTSKDDAIAAMQSQHAIDLSERDSAFRRAEDEAYQQTSRVHEMSKQIGDLEQELASLRSQLVSREDTVGEPSASAGNATPRSDGQRSATFAIPVPVQVAPPSASIDASLPPSMRHKRQVSLAMLKARMNGPPVSLGGRGLTSRVASSDAIAEEDETEGHRVHLGSTFESQISDDAVFWCPECHGDLITL